MGGKCIMDKYVLITHDEDWADEFNATGFHVMTEKEWDEHKVRAKKIFDDQPYVKDWQDNRHPRPVEYYFGTNEFLEWDTYDRWLEDIKVTKLTDALAATLRSLFKPWMRYGFGIIPYELQGD